MDMENVDELDMAELEDSDSDEIQLTAGQVKALLTFLVQ